MPSPVSPVLGLNFLRQTASNLTNCGAWRAAEFQANGLSEEIEELIFFFDGVFTVLCSGQ